MLAAAVNPLLNPANKAIIGGLIHEMARNAPPTSKWRRGVAEAFDMFSVLW